jgi:hypothetical protein
MRRTSRARHIRVLTGGYVGVEERALAVAAELGLQTGGIAAPCFFNGSLFRLPLRDTYGLVSYPKRMKKRTTRTLNMVSRADGTICFCKQPHSAFVSWLREKCACGPKKFRARTRGTKPSRAPRRTARSFRPFLCLKHVNNRNRVAQCARDIRQFIIRHDIRILHVTDEGGRASEELTEFAGRVLAAGLRTWAHPDNSSISSSSDSV